MSLTRTLRAARRSIRRSGGDKVSPAAGILHATQEILEELLPRRRRRANPRVVRRKMTSFVGKRPEHRHWPQPTLPTPAAIRILSPP